MKAKVDAHLKENKQWRKELQELRRIVLDCGLTEEWKWNKPCYTFQGGNIAILYGLKERCAIGFMKGGLLKDPKGILIKAGENTESGRWIKFSNIDEITSIESTLKAYIRQAIEVEKAGLKVPSKDISEYKLPEELKNKFAENPALKTAFKALTPGRQKGYIFFFSGAKQSQTRISRIEKCAPNILKGIGLNEPPKKT